jgi:hypothetical protein
MIMQTLITAATAAVVMLATAAGALVTADWQADVQSCQAWAQLGFAVPELNQAADTGTPPSIDLRCPALAPNAALRHVFRAHRVVLPLAADDRVAAAPTNLCVGRPTQAEPCATQSMSAAVSKPVHHRETGPQSEASIFHAALKSVGDTRAAGALKVTRSYRAAQFRVKRATERPRLVANGRVWSVGSTCDLAVNTADIIVLSSGRHEDSPQSLPDASVRSNGSEDTAMPSCRGPPHVIPRRPHKMRTIAKRAGAVPLAVVRDDLGPQIPICTAELDVIESYLGHLMQDLLAASKDDLEPEQA